VKVNGKELTLAINYAETETALIAKAQQGDRNAFGELVRRHHPGVVTSSIACAVMWNWRRTRAQDAFIQAWLNLSSFRPGTSLRNWLYRIAVNAALDVLRREPKPLP